MKILIVFYSAYGHIYKMALAMAEGVKEVDGAKVELRKAQETLPADVLAKTGIAAAQKAFAHIPVATLEDLEKADAIIIGTPTRFGNMCSQMRAFFDSTGALWMRGALIGKVGSVFTSSATQHGGAGDDDFEHPQYPPASWYGYRRFALYLLRSNDNRRDHRMLPVWRVDHYRRTG